MLQFKQNVLADNGFAARAEIRPVHVDLRDDWPTALLRAGFDRSAPTAWLADQQPMAGMAKDFGLSVVDMWPGDKVFAPVRWLADHG